MQPGRYTLKLESENLAIQATAGQTVLEALIAAGIFLRTDCGGKGSCGKCRIKILSALTGSGPDESEIKVLGQPDLAAGWRLACRLKVSQNLSLIIPETSRLSAEVAQKGLPMLLDKLSRLKSQQTGSPDSYGAGGRSGDHDDRGLPVRLSSGAVTASTSARNPQTLFGDDVMSRISAIRLDPGLLARQQKMAVSAIEWGIDSLCRSTRVDPAKITEMTVVGNSTMIHIFAGENPSSIGVFPYHAALSGRKASAGRTRSAFDSTRIAESELCR